MNTSSYNVFFLGDAGVGKSALIARLLNEPFQHKYTQTMGVQVRKHPKTNIKLWDFTGSDVLRGELSSTLLKRRPDAVVVVYDTTSKTSEKNIVKWISEVRGVPVIVVANKTDAKSFNDDLPIEVLGVSARTGHNVEKLLASIQCAL